MSDQEEQRVRVKAGWVGVEISKSRVRTPGKTGFGLYRVRTAAERHWHVGEPPAVPAGEWTGYLFELEAIENAVDSAIQTGTHAKPGDLILFHPSPKQARRDKPAMLVRTRWTSAYRGRRDLGTRRDLRRDLEDLECEDPVVRAAAARLDEAVHGIVSDARLAVEVKPEYAAQVGALAALLDAAVIEMVHVEGCSCRVSEQRFTAACVRATMPDRMRQRAENAAFQADHLRRRAHGLEQRYQQKRARGNIIDSD